MTQDIVVRLRGSYHNPENEFVDVSPKLLVSAAEEIERLRIQLAELGELYNASQKMASNRSLELDIVRRQAYQSRSNGW